MKGWMALALGYCIWQSQNLLSAWQSSYYDRNGWIAILIWMIPVGLALLNPRHGRATPRTQAVFLMAALAITCLGQLGSMNVIRNAGLALALVGIAWRSPLHGFWLLAGLSWTPAFGWLASKLSPDHVLPARLIVATCGTIAFFVGLHIMRPARSVATRRTTDPAPPQASFSMSAGHRSLVATLVFCVALACLAEFGRPNSQRDLKREVPAVGLGFRSHPFPLTPEESDRLRHVDVLKRLYQVGNQKFILMVIDGSRHRHAIHDPLYCFSARGWKQHAEHKIQLRHGQARKVVMEKQGRTAEIVYWFSDGQVCHHSIMRYWWQTTLRRVSCGWSGPEPVMVTLQPLGENRLDWTRIFARTLFLANL